MGQYPPIKEIQWTKQLRRDTRYSDLDIVQYINIDGKHLNHPKKRREREEKNSSEHGLYMTLYKQANMKGAKAKYSDEILNLNAIRQKHHIFHEFHHINPLQPLPMMLMVVFMVLVFMMFMMLVVPMVFMMLMVLVMPFPTINRHTTTLLNLLLSDRCLHYCHILFRLSPVLLMLCYWYSSPRIFTSYRLRIHLLPFDPKNRSQPRREIHKCNSYWA